MTERQFDVWDQWLDDEWNQPNRTDHYLMKVMHETRYQGVKDRPTVTLKEAYGIEFEFTNISAKAKKTQEELNAEAGRMAEQAWCAMFGLEVGKDSDGAKPDPNITYKKES